MTITLKNNQTLFDVAIQYMGDAAHAETIAQANGVYASVDLPAGYGLQIPEIELTSEQQKVVKYYAVNNIVPAGNKP